MQGISDFVEGPLLVTVIVLFLLGVVCRSVRFAYSISKANGSNATPQTKTKANLLRFLIPLHRVTKKNPFRVMVFYLFHIILVIVPVWTWSIRATNTTNPSR